jgi:Gas vesicle protein
VTEPGTDLTGSRPYRSSMAQQPRSTPPANLADILERVLDKGIVIAGDIRVNLLDIELLTIKIRLLVASVDKAQEMGIDWWRNDPMLSTSAQGLVEENRRLRERVEALELESADPADDEETEEDTEGETEVRAGVPDR